MSKSGQDKRQLKNIFEESLREISSEGTDEFRRSVTDVLSEQPAGKKVKKEQPSQQGGKSGGLNTTEL